MIGSPTRAGTCAERVVVESLVLIACSEFPLPIGRGWREAPGEGPLKKMLSNPLQDLADITRHFVIPKTQNRVALALKKRGAMLIRNSF
jgi:hypothetical protein